MSQEDGGLYVYRVEFPRFEKRATARCRPTDPPAILFGDSVISKQQAPTMCVVRHHPPSATASPQSVRTFT